MSNKFRTTLLAGLVVLLFLTMATTARAGGYESLQGLDSLKTVFDFRDKVPASANVHLKLVHMTYKDQSVKNVTKSPQFVVIFMDRSVKLISGNRDGFSAEEKKLLDEMAATLSAMAKDGIRLEVCLVAANFFGVDPATFPKEIHQVDNGWISSMGYQTQGYALVPAY